MNVLPIELTAAMEVVELTPAMEVYELTEDMMLRPLRPSTRPTQPPLDLAAYRRRQGS